VQLAVKAVLPMTQSAQATLFGRTLLFVYEPLNFPQ
jgi:hypothetical protein